MSHRYLHLGLMLLAACSVSQRGALLGTRNAYARTDYDNCVARAEEGIDYGEHDERISAELLFYKALCLESARRASEAVVYYRRTIERYPSTDFAAQAEARLKALEAPK